MFSAKLVSRFWLARTWFALSLVYAAGLILAALFFGAASGAQGTDYQFAFLLNGSAVVLLWAGLIIARPKPKRPRPRTVFVALEYLLVGLIFSLALVLFAHHGWHITPSAPAGFAAIAWGIGWIAVWLGPVFIGVLVVLLGHWVWLDVFMDYRNACWRFVEEDHTLRLLGELGQYLQVDDFLREKDAQYVGRKLIHWQLSTPWKPFELGLPSSKARLHGQIQASEDGQQNVLVLEKRAASDPEQVMQTIRAPWPQGD